MGNKFCRWIVFFTVALGLGAGIVGTESLRAQEAQSSQQPYAVGQLGLDLTVPESPAFTILGLNPQNVTHTTSPRDFAAQILNGVDRNGNFQSGLAIDLNVWGIAERNGAYEFFYGQPLYVSTEDGEGYVDGDFSLWFPMKKWDQRRLLRNFLFRTSFSFATTKGTESDDKSLRLAGGVRFVPWDPGDPKMFVGICMKRRVDGMEWVGRLLKDSNDILSALEARRRSLEYRTVDGSEVERTTFSAGERKEIEEIEAAQEALGELVGVTDGSTPTPQDYDKTVQLILDLLPPLRERLLIKCDGDCLEAGAVPTGGAEDRASLSLVSSQAVGQSRRLAAEAGKVKEWIDKYQGYLPDKLAAEKTIPREPSDESPAANETVTAPDNESALQRALKAAARVIKEKEEKHKQELAEAGINADAVAKVAEAIVNQCKNANKGKDNRSSWAISAAPSWISRDGSTSELKWNGGAVWTSVSLGPDLLDISDGPVGPTAEDIDSDTTPRQDTWNVILHARYRFSEQQPMEVAKQGSATAMKTALFEQDGFLLGGRLRFLVTESLHISGEGAWIKLNGNKNAAGEGFSNDSYWQFAIIPSLKIPGSSNWWIDVAVGTDVDRKNQGDNAFILSNIKYGFRQDPPPQ